MALMIQISPLLAKMPAFRFPMRNIQLSMPQKVAVISVSVGVVLIGFLARYFRRRRRALPPGNLRRLEKRAKAALYGSRSPNGDVLSQAGSGRHSASPSIRSLHRQGSVVSDRMSVASGSVAGALPSMSGEPGAHLTPQQLGLMGMEALDTAVSYWEDALAIYTSGHPAAGDGPLAVTSAEEAEFVRDLQRLLDAAIKLQSESEAMFLDQRSVLFRTDSSTRLHGDAGTGVTSTNESFVSAQDEVADLREFEEFAEVPPDIENLPLYQSALRRFEESGIPYRCLRTEMVHCSSDVEYLVKLHCIRIAFQYMFKDATKRQWFADAGRQVLTDLLLFADKDPKDFLIAYEDMMDFLQEKSFWNNLHQELSLKGVKAMTFYDVVLDYILMDAFEDLESPPSSVTAVVQNRWLSNGFKETALTTAVWSVLKAKRRMLKFPYGFMAHFYAISEQISPLMAWGFLGPDEQLRDTCHHFKDQVMGFLLDIFSFHKTRYTTVEEMAHDIFVHIKDRVNAICQKMAAQG